MKTVERRRAWEAPSSAPINSGLGRSSGWSQVGLSYEAKQTTKDTITVRVIESRRNTVVWEATAREYVTHNYDDELAAGVAEFVSALLAEYPSPAAE